MIGRHTTGVLIAFTLAIHLERAHVERFAAVHQRLPSFVRGAAVGALCVLAIMFRGTEAPFIYFAF